MNTSTVETIRLDLVGERLAKVIDEDFHLVLLFGNGRALIVNKQTVEMDHAPVYALAR